MSTRIMGRLVLGLLLLLGIAGKALTHPGHGGGTSNNSSSGSSGGSGYGTGESEGSKPRPPEPYRGQKICPVTGERLGSHGAPLEVQVPSPVVRKRTFLEWIGLKKQPQTEMVPIFVCCPECAARVRSDPQPGQYLVRVVAERGGNTRQ